MAAGFGRELPGFGDGGLGGLGVRLAGAGLRGGGLVLGELEQAEGPKGADVLAHRPALLVVGARATGLPGLGSGDGVRLGGVGLLDVQGPCAAEAWLRAEGDHGIELPAGLTGGGDVHVPAARAVTGGRGRWARRGRGCYSGHDRRLLVSLRSRPRGSSRLPRGHVISGPRWARCLNTSLPKPGRASKPRIRENRGIPGIFRNCSGQNIYMN
jgi:hypothetical protein